MPPKDGFPGRGDFPGGGDFPGRGPDRDDEPKPEAELLAVGDFDGDGAQEDLRQWSHSDGVFVEDGGARDWAGYEKSANLHSVADVDGDGADDAIWKFEGGGYFYRSDGTGDREWLMNDPKKADVIGVGDADGDGKEGLVFGYHGSDGAFELDGDGQRDWLGYDFETLGQTSDTDCGC